MDAVVIVRPDVIADACAACAPLVHSCCRATSDVNWQKTIKPCLGQSVAQVGRLHFTCTVNQNCRVWSMARNPFAAAAAATRPFFAATMHAPAAPGESDWFQDLACTRVTRRDVVLRKAKHVLADAKYAACRAIWDGREGPRLAMRLMNQPVLAGSNAEPIDALESEYCLERMRQTHYRGTDMMVEVKLVEPRAQAAMKVVTTAIGEFFDRETARLTRAADGRDPVGELPAPVMPAVYAGSTGAGSKTNAMRPIASDEQAEVATLADASTWLPAESLLPQSPNIVPLVQPEQIITREWIASLHAMDLSSAVRALGSLIPPVAYEDPHSAIDFATMLALHASNAAFVPLFKAWHFCSGLKILVCLEQYDPTKMDPGITLAQSESVWKRIRRVCSGDYPAAEAFAAIDARFTALLAEVPATAETAKQRLRASNFVSQAQFDLMESAAVALTQERVFTLAGLFRRMHVNHHAVPVYLPIGVLTVVCRDIAKTAPTAKRAGNRPTPSPTLHAWCVQFHKDNPPPVRRGKAGKAGDDGDGEEAEEQLAPTTELSQPPPIFIPDVVRTTTNTRDAREPAMPVSVWPAVQARVLAPPAATVSSMPVAALPAPQTAIEGSAGDSNVAPVAAQHEYAHVRAHNATTEMAPTAATVMPTAQTEAPVALTTVVASTEIAYTPAVSMVRASAEPMEPVLPASNALAGLLEHTSEHMPLLEPSTSGPQGVQSRKRKADADADNDVQARPPKRAKTASGARMALLQQVALAHVLLLRQIGTGGLDDSDSDE